MSRLDEWILQADRALRAVTGVTVPERAVPGNGPAVVPGPDDLAETERRHSAGLMRVNHVGEVCAQALYQSQALTCTRRELRDQFNKAAREEADHLAWTAIRLEELGARPSILNPLWYAGAFALGLLAGKAGDRVSLGFLVETERQVERHLAGHLDSLPARDLRSRAIVAQMRDDEMQHAEDARQAGAMALPDPVRDAMRVAAKVMTSTAYHL